jgi:sugar phosphate isomerase/epimerase
MVAYGFERGSVLSDLEIAHRLGATALEIFPDWRAYPDPAAIRAIARDHGFEIHSAHGSWGGQSIQARRVDLGSTDPEVRSASVDDLRRCLDWLNEAGGTCLVIHPGGLSDPSETAARRESLRLGLNMLADHVEGSGLVACVENMPPGVHPGSAMKDVADLVAEIRRPEIALAIDTGHAHMVGSVDGETLAAGSLLRTTHVHDNHGKADAHLPPGAGTVDWARWAQALKAIEYQGPIMLECIRELRKNPDVIDAGFLARLDLLRRTDRPTDEARAG